MSTETKLRLSRGQLEYDAILHAQEAFKHLAEYGASIAVVLRETVRYAENQLTDSYASDFFQKEVLTRLVKECPDDLQARQRFAALLALEFAKYFVNEQFATEE